MPAELLLVNRIMSKDVVILTGATGGIGSALCRVLRDSAPDMQLILLQRHSSPVKDPHVLVVPADFSMPGEYFSASLLDTLRQADAVTLVLCSGTISPLGTIGSFTDSQIQNSLAVNTTAPLTLINTCVRTVAPDKLRIIQLDSGAAYRPIHGWSLYCAGKAAVSLYLQTLVLETSVKAVCFDPGVVDTGMQKTIRCASVEQCRDVSLFKTYKQEHKLNSPETVALYIYNRYIHTWQAETLREKIVL